MWLHAWVYVPGKSKYMYAWIMPGESRSILSNRETGVSIRIIEWNLVLLIMGPGLVVHSLI